MIDESKRDGLIICRLQVVAEASQMADSNGYGWMCDVNVGIGECRTGYRKHCLDSSDGMGSDGEVDEGLRSVGWQWSGRGGSARRIDRQGRMRTRWVMDGAVCL